MAKPVTPQDMFDLWQKMVNPGAYPLQSLMFPVLDSRELDKKIAELEVVEIEDAIAPTDSWSVYAKFHSWGSFAESHWHITDTHHLMSGVRLARALLPAMKARDWGRIVFISSESAINIPAEMVHYGMTKTAQLAVARGLAESLAGTGITVNSVLPGPTRSRGVKGFLDKMAAELGQRLRAEEVEQFTGAWGRGSEAGLWPRPFSSSKTANST